MQYNISFIDQLCIVKMIEYWPCYGIMGGPCSIPIPSPPFLRNRCLDVLHGGSHLGIRFASQEGSIQSRSWIVNLWQKPLATPGTQLP